MQCTIGLDNSIVVLAVHQIREVQTQVCFLRDDSDFSLKERVAALDSLCFQFI